MLAGVADLADSRPGLADTGELALPYVTECYRADLD